MTAIVLTTYLHFTALFILIGALMAEQFIVTKSMSQQDLHRVAVLDKIYWLGVFSAIIAGLILWFWVGKPAEFYTKNWIFHTKLTLFISAISLSIYTSLHFKKLKSKINKEGKIGAPRLLVICLRLVLLILLTIPLLANFVALGVGAF